MPRYIDADDLRDNVLNDNTYDNDTVNYYLGWIDDTPTADVVPVMHGEWVTTRTIIHDGELYCSLCGQEALAEYGRHTYIKSNYCPNCGADMRIESEAKE